MKSYSPKLFILMNHTEYVFVAGEETETNNFKIIYKSNVPMQGFDEYKITNFDLVFNDLKKNVYLIEQKLNFTFKDIVLVIDNFKCSYINLTGFKKLNGSQVLKEDIIYILNSLKSYVSETEEKKKIIHIFNSKYSLDKKNIVNLPIGLYGDFYSHELSFCLINDNDYKNLNNIFGKCNLKITKILSKSFIEASHINNINSPLDTFYKININENKSKIFYFENSSLKFEQNFNFGSNLIIQDICKVTSLKKDIVEKIINSINFNQNIIEDELIDKKIFVNNIYTKIKKKLILEIAEARIRELLEKFIFKNVNLSLFNKKKDNIVFVTINDMHHYKCFKSIYDSIFSENEKIKFLFKKNTTIEELINNVNKIVHFGWKREAIPLTFQKKSMIAKLFEILFN